MRHVLWVNELAELTGGCEQYVCNTAGLLKERGVRNSLLYDGSRSVPAQEMKDVFDSIAPMSMVTRQATELRPDLIYVHRLTGEAVVSQLAATGIPVVRFFHDHRLFCLREHKYKTLTHRTCTKPIGLRCYPCLGFIRRGSRGPGFTFSTVRALRKEIRANLGLTAFVVASRYMADHIAAHGFARERIHVLPLYAMPPEDATPLPREPDLLVFAGQLIRGKGLDVLLKALQRTQHPARLAVIGSGRQESMYRAMTASLGLDSRVTFLGKQSRAELADYYRRAACVVFPSRAPETFGLVGPEAMSCGAPVIATAVGGISEWLDHDVTGLAVPSNDSAVLAKAIDRVVGDPALAARFSKSARQRYDQQFRPEHHIKALIALFEAIERLRN